MIWKDFLQTLTSASQIDVIGPFGSNWAPADRPVLFVDSGIRWRKPVRISASVGDGDSSAEPMDQVLDREKSYSDFAYALHSLPQNIDEIFLWGFLGGRRDHELACFGEAHAFLKARLKPTALHWENQITSWSAGSWETDIRGTFSLFVLEPAEITVTGDCRYRLGSPTPLASLSSFGLSNEASGAVQITTTGPLFCVRNAETA